MKGYIRLPRESLFDPRIEALPPNVFRTWLKLLALARFREPPPGQPDLRGCLAEPDRYRHLQPMAIDALADSCNISRRTIIRHLQILRSSGLADTIETPDGRRFWRVHVTPSHVSALTPPDGGCVSAVTPGECQPCHPPGVSSDTPCEYIEVSTLTPEPTALNGPNAQHQQGQTDTSQHSQQPAKPADLRNPENAQVECIGRMYKKEGEERDPPSTAKTPVLRPEQRDSWKAAIAALTPLLQALMPGNEPVQQRYLRCLASEVVAGRRELSLILALLEFPRTRPDPIVHPWPEAWLRNALQWQESYELRWWRLAPITRLFPAEWDSWLAAWEKAATKHGLERVEQVLEEIGPLVECPPVEPDGMTAIEWYHRCKNIIAQMEG